MVEKNDDLDVSSTVIRRVVILCGYLVKKLPKISEIYSFEKHEARAAKPIATVVF